MVEKALNDRGTTLPAYFAAGRSSGRTVAELHVDLQALAGVEFAERTLYRWIEDLDGAAR